MSDTFIVIGAGQAGLQVCDSLRREGFSGRLLLIGDEEMLPYQRPPLSKQFLQGEIELSRLPFRPENFFEKKDIELVIGKSVLAINRDEQSIVLDGQTFNYDKLALTTGTRVRKLPCPGGDLPGVHYLRTARDALAIKEDLDSAKSLIAIGGGFIGLEIAAVASTMNLDVTVIEAQGRLMERAVSPVISDYFAAVHTNQGVNLSFNASVSSIEKTAAGFEVAIGDQALLSADMLVAGIGAIPNAEIAQQCGIECDNGIVVDSCGRTSDPDIFAAGDCTMHDNVKLRVRHRLESVQNAVDQAKTVAAAMMGVDKPYTQIPWFWSDQYDKKLQMVGTSKDADQTIVRGDPSKHSFSVFYFKDNALIGVDSINQAKDHMIGRKFLNNDIPLEPAQAADDTLDLKGLAT